MPTCVATSKRSSKQCCRCALSSVLLLRTWIDACCASAVRFIHDNGGSDDDQRSCSVRMHIRVALPCSAAATSVLVSHSHRRVVRHVLTTAPTGKNSLPTSCGHFSRPPTVCPISASAWCRRRAHVLRRKVRLCERPCCAERVHDCRFVLMICYGDFQ